VLVFRKPRVSAADRRKVKKGSQLAPAGDSSESSRCILLQAWKDKGLESVTELFKDKAHYLEHAPAHDRVVEAAYSAAGTIAASESRMNNGDTVAADMDGIARFDDGAFDILGDEKDLLSKARRIHYWDAKKRKFLWVNAAEVSKGARRKPSMRNEAGALVDRNQMAGKKHEYGEVYRKWVKSTRQQVAAAGDEGESGADRVTVAFADDDEGGYEERSAKRPRLDGSAGKGTDGTRGRHVRDELLSAAQIKKERLRKAKSQGKLRKFQSGKGGTPVGSDKRAGARGAGGGRGRGRGSGRR
jgi:hypothetical protein